MNLFTGITRTDYQDLLRALGHIADSEGWQALRLHETEDGILLQGLPKVRERRARNSYGERFFPDEELRTTLIAAYQRRGQAAQAGPPHGCDTNQDTLRALGACADSLGWRMIRIVETLDGLLLQGLETQEQESLGLGYRTRFITREELPALITSAFDRRVAGRPEWRP